ncbi:MAG: thiamine biosynthesis protein ThiH [Bacteroidetes bacterium]|jgi:2-iminoacetate synthase|nr:thiamine biosynthesis protein ThiH [Bacteroidota bacterium]
MTFKDQYLKYTWNEIQNKISSKTILDVERALSKSKLNLEDFAALISPAALPYLEQMAQKSRALTMQRFGKTIQMFAPMYLSNECNNICTYCGYSFDNKIKRRTLTDSEIVKEAEAIKQLGFDHVLLVTGEANATVHVPYFLNAIKLIKPHFSNISVEVQPLEQEEYAQLHEAGVYSILVYQETYDQEAYKLHHPKGKKSNFFYRLDTPDRVGQSKIHKIGLGALLGLSDWRTDSFFCAMHLDYLQKKYWQTKYSISFPRIRPAEGVEISNEHISDKELLQLICAYRIFNPDVELSVSTRETATFRDNIIKLGATSMSAGSKTNPGGYSVDPQSLEQFEIDDTRTPQEFMKVISKQGYEAMLKDWDRAFSQ